MIMVSKVIVKQYSPYRSRQDQLPSGGEALLSPIYDKNRPYIEHLDQPMMNESNCEYTMLHEHVQQIHIW